MENDVLTDTSELKDKEFYERNDVQMAIVMDVVVIAPTILLYFILSLILTFRILQVLFCCTKCCGKGAYRCALFCLFTKRYFDAKGIKIPGDENISVGDGDKSEGYETELNTSDLDIVAGNYEHLHPDYRPTAPILPENHSSFVNHPANPHYDSLSASTGLASSTNQFKGDLSVEKPFSFTGTEGNDSNREYLYPHVKKNSVEPYHRTKVHPTSPLLGGNINNEEIEELQGSGSLGMVANRGGGGEEGVSNISGVSKGRVNSLSTNQSVFSSILRGDDATKYVE